jgi:tripeptide aminopeptidase
MRAAAKSGGSYLFDGRMIMTPVLDRFLKYVSFDTQSDEFSETCPSTDKQKLLGAYLVEEMKTMGIKDACMDENGYIYGTVPGDPKLPTIGLIAHMDTAPDCSGADIKARIVEYLGGDVCLNEQQGIFLRESDYPTLKNHIGKHLVVTDGTTLLGADDKAGIAEIMTAAEFLLTARMNHATLKIGFTPDEEIGRGADRFDVQKFGADYAYTADGGPVGEIEYENFNAAGAKVDFYGLNIHPGSAKDKMVNSQYIAMEFQSLLPAAQKPEHTEGYEGFIHLTDMQGEVEKSTLRYIIRDHDMAKFQEKKSILQAAADFINVKYGIGTCELTVRDSYYNMREKIEPVKYVVDRAKRAMHQVGMEAVEVPIRGGTDGARLSFEGLPCPNLCTGGENYHGRFEFIPVEDMEQCVQMLVAILTTVE